jgi:peptidyl-prolyl cis-trans isomerase A (cyclophilin A)
MGLNGVDGIARMSPRRMSVSGVAAIVLLVLAACATGQGDNRTALLDTSASAEPAPEVFRVRFETSRGPFVVEAHRDWSPFGVDRFYYLVRRGFYDGNRFFRVIPGLVAQFGISGDPAIAASWRDRRMPDDTAQNRGNTRGRVSFATAGRHMRTTQLFINYKDNGFLDARGFAPIGEVIEGMSVVDSLWSGYGDNPPAGAGPDQSRIYSEGNRYLDESFPNLDYIRTARIVK